MLPLSKSGKARVHILGRVGDLGFKDIALRNSTYFTIALVTCDDSKAFCALAAAVKKTLKNKINRRNKNMANELKAAKMTDE